MGIKIPYKDIFFIKNNLDKTDEYLAKTLGRTVASVKGIRKRRNLLKTFETKFQKGHKSRGVNTKPNKTSFKKGCLPKNTLYDGCIKIRVSKGISYQWVRVAKAEWRLLHREIWEKSNGPIPPGLLVVFRDKNSLNCELSNLELISRGQNAIRNSDRKKTSLKMKKNWNKVKLYEANGLKHEFKLKSKRKLASVKGINTDANKHTTF